MRITAVETRSYGIDLDPPFAAAWDPVPRTRFGATLVIVHTDEGLTGYASGGDGLPDRELIEHHLRGVDPRQTEVVREVLETIDLHGGRPWVVDLACWDIAGKAAGEPVWRLLGGRTDRLIAYASTGETADAAERVHRAATLVEHGIRAIKVRFHHDDWHDDLLVVEGLRAALGTDIAIMVDANQGWRMPGDRAPRWDVATAVQCARALEALDVYWLEEPLPCEDVGGYAALRQRTSMRIAAGELVRSIAEARDLVLGGGVDVIQVDAALCGGITGCRRLAALADLCGRVWSPHTWTNGLGLLANLHAAVALSTCPYIEVPYDPPAWTPERRDFLMPEPLVVASDGTISAPHGPGLGVSPDLEALEAYRTD